MIGEQSDEHLADRARRAENGDRPLGFAFSRKGGRFHRARRVRAIRS